jgi:hypothetical protein
MYSYIPIISARQRLSKRVPAATNTQATIEELLDASVFMRSVSNQRNVGDQLCPSRLVIFIFKWKTRRRGINDIIKINTDLQIFISFY